MIRFDAGEVAALAADLGKIASRTVPTMVAVFTEAGDDLEEKWRNNARETAGSHGKHYPDSIDSERLISTNISIEIGPNTAKPQGGMSFEYGSANQPPHLDGQRAADEIIPKLERRVSIALSDLGL